MESSSWVCISPSFNGNDIADIADRVVRELRTENGNDDAFSFSDDDNHPTVIGDVIINNNNPTEIVNPNENDNVFSFGATVIRNNDDVINTNNHPEEDEHDEFEFPVVCRDSNLSVVSTDEASFNVFDDQISLQYPVFDRSLLSETDLNISNGVDSLETESKPPPSPRQSLRKLFSEDRDAPSTSSSEADDFDGVTPGTYCVWKPKTESQPPRGKHKKSNSISIGNTSKKWKVRDLLKRSYSDDSYSTGKESPVVVFLPPISPKQKKNGEKVNKSEKSEKTGKAGSGGGGVASGKTERNIPAYRTKIGNIRVPPYLPYRQGQVAAFGNFTGSSKNLYRY